jgi:hypothetical protein
MERLLRTCPLPADMGAVIPNTSPVLSKHACGAPSTVDGSSISARQPGCCTFHNLVKKSKNSNQSQSLSPDKVALPHISGQSLKCHTYRTVRSVDELRNVSSTGLIFKSVTSPACPLKFRIILLS